MSNFMETYGKALSIKTISFDCLNFIYEINKCSLRYCNNQKVVNSYV